MKYSKAVGCVVILSAALIGNTYAASSTYNGTLDLTDYQYSIDYNGANVAAAADMVRFDLGTGLIGDMEMLLTTGYFSGFSMLGMALTTDPNDALFNDPSTFLQLSTSTDVTGFFNDNVLGWELYLWGNDFIKPSQTNDITSFFGSMQFDPNEHYYAFVAGGAISGFGSNVDVVLTVNDASVVPIPAAVWLFGTGIVGFIGLGKRKKTLA